MTFSVELSFLGGRLRTIRRALNNGPTTAHWGQLAVGTTFSIQRVSVNFLLRILWNNLLNVVLTGPSVPLNLYVQSFFDQRYQPQGPYPWRVSSIASAPKRACLQHRLFHP